MILEGLFGIVTPAHRTGAGVTIDDRVWLQNSVGETVSSALARAKGKPVMKIKKMASNVFMDVLALASQVYVSSHRIREEACAAQATFLANAVAEAA